MLQSLAQIKTIFAEGAWEGVVGNCDSLLYLGGNEASTFEYISKLLGKWTIDKKTNGESKGSSGSVSENYDVLGRELMNEYEVRLLKNDECILFVRGEEPMRDKKWLPWEHEEYRLARECVEDLKSFIDVDDSLGCDFINEKSLEYLRKRKENGENVQIEEMDVWDFMMMDLDSIYSDCKDEKTSDFENGYEIESDVFVDTIKLKKMQEKEERDRYKKEKSLFFEMYDELDLYSVYMSKFMTDARREVIKKLSKKGCEDEVILKIVDPRGSEEEMELKKKVWVEMKG